MINKIWSYWEKKWEFWAIKKGTGTFCLRLWGSSWGAELIKKLDIARKSMNNVSRQRPDNRFMHHAGKYITNYAQISFTYVEPSLFCAQHMHFYTAKALTMIAPPIESTSQLYSDETFHDLCTEVPKRVHQNYAHLQRSFVAASCKIRSSQTQHYCKPAWKTRTPSAKINVENNNSHWGTHTWAKKKSDNKVEHSRNLHKATNSTPARPRSALVCEQKKSPNLPEWRHAANKRVKVFDSILRHGAKMLHGSAIHANGSSHFVVYDWKSLTLFWLKQARCES